MHDHVLPLAQAIGDVSNEPFASLGFRLFGYVHVLSPLLQSDDNFSAGQVTRVVALGVENGLLR
jgi:hypothetical protein